MIPDRFRRESIAAQNCNSHQPTAPVPPEPALLSADPPEAICTNPDVLDLSVAPPATAEEMEKTNAAFVKLREKFEEVFQARDLLWKNKKPNDNVSEAWNAFQTQLIYLRVGLYQLNLRQCDLDDALRQQGIAVPALSGQDYAGVFGFAAPEVFDGPMTAQQLKERLQQQAIRL